VSLPLSPPLLPQLALSRKALPDAPGWSYEPKWDGFRAIVFVDGDSADIQSRNGKPLTRYFPELRFPAGRYVLDGEIVILNERGGQEFDLLSIDDEVLLDRPQHERRARLERFIADHVTDDTTVDLTPSTTDPAQAEPWLHGAEGVIAKELDSPYRSNERKGMVKIKRVRTIDAVVFGWRPGKEEGTVGSLILGLYDDGGELRVVGHTSGFSAKEKRELPARLKPYETGERGSADPSRWDSGRELEWIGLRPELVVEVTFDHVSGGRIRHGAKVQRWRTDKDPSACTVDQLDS
jgi:ATP-dependent DNA ligase